MIRLPRLLRYLLFFAAGLALSGCSPATNSNLDEQKEHYFLAGRSRVNNHDYAGAIDQFEKAIEVNPRSAAAHFELGWLNEEQKKDYAAAIYHYEQHLRLKPESEYAERARERIRACKMDLAKSEMLSPIIQGLESDLRRLGAENTTLKRQVESLQSQLAARPAITPPAPAHPSNHLPSGPTLQISETPVVPPQDPIIRPAPSARTRQYVVQNKDTLYSIAARHGIHVTKLQAANPGVEPHRLRAGQTLAIPSP
jgi:LysM repeat protein